MFAMALKNKDKSKKSKSDASSAPMDQAKPSVTSQAFPFLKLPGEIRNIVYSFLVFPHHETILAVYHTKPEDMSKSILKAPILRVSRQIRKESLSFLCSSKSIAIFNIMPMVIFIQCVGATGQAHLTDISLTLTDLLKYVRDSGYDKEDWLVELSKLTRLRIFHICMQRYLPGLTAAEWGFLGKIKETVENIKGAVFSWQLIDPASMNMKAWPRSPEVDKFLGKNYVDRDTWIMAWG